MGDDNFGGFAPAVELDGVKVFLGDCIEVLKSLPDNSVDSIVTDPPYGLEFMGKDWDAPWKGNGTVEQVFEGQDKSHPFRDGSSRIRYGNKDMLGFQLWATEWSVECLRVLKPGGHLLAFGGTRTWHRLAVAIEDAGFEIRDNIAWMYGSGFPKSLDVSKAIDKMDAKAERRSRDLRFTGWMRSTGITAKEINELTSSNMGSHYLTDKEQPAVPTEDMFGLLRPYLPAVPEDIERLVFERTVESKNFAEREVIGVKNAGIGTGQSYGKIVGEREAVTSTEVPVTAPATPEAEKWSGWGTALKPAFEPIVLARKPLSGTVAETVLEWGTGGLNIDGSRIGVEKIRSSGQGIKSGSGNYIGGGKDIQPPSVHEGRWPANVILDEYTADLLDQQSGVSKSTGGRIGKKDTSNIDFGLSGKYQKGDPGFGDTGGASRFFYVAKASKRDRNEGLEHLEAKHGSEVTGRKLDAPGAKHGRAGMSQTPRQNIHPTVKPTALMRYLVKLVTPPGGIVLDPFTGSGSTGKAAILEGFEFVGVELTEDYLPIIEGRLKWALENRDGGTLF